MKLKIKFNLISKLLCLVGCVYQAVNISKLYFSYKTTTNVRYERNSNIELPGISICTPKSLMFKEEQDDINQIDQNSTTGQMFSWMENDLSQLYYCSVIGKNGSKMRSCPENDEIARYIDGYYFCFTIFSQLKGEPDDNYLVHEGASNQQILININFIIPDNFMVFTKLIVHSRGEMIYRSYVKGEVNLNNSKSLIITYRKTVVKYLFIPKRNPCFMGQTYDSCIAKCRIREFINKTGKYPGDFLTNKVNSSLKISKYRNAMKFVWSENCNQFCSQFTDCYKEYFIVSSKPSRGCKLCH